MQTHDVPETRSDERMHIFDKTCWCKPECESFIPRDGGEVETVVHHFTEARSRMRELIERSSLGTPEAKALRDSVPAEVAREIVRRSKESA